MPTSDAGSSPSKRPSQTVASAPPTLTMAPPSSLPQTSSLGAPSQPGSRFLISPVQEVISQQQQPPPPVQPCQPSVAPVTQPVVSEALTQTLPPQTPLQQQEVHHAVSGPPTMTQQQAAYVTPATAQPLLDPSILSATSAANPQLPQNYPQAVADMGAVYGHPQSLDPKG